MMKVIQEVLLETVKITSIATILMIIIECIEVKYKKRLKSLLLKNRKTQIVGSALLGVIPGCVDAFLIVSLYMHGMVGFGALVAVMLSTAGDEAFVMLAMIPEAALLIFIACAFLGIVGGFLAEWIAKKVNLKRSKVCVIRLHKETSVHFLKVHVINHIIKKHVPKLFAWIFFTLLLVEILVQNFDLNSILPQNKLLLLLLAAIIGIIPESGPHLIFLTLYSKGLIPFSVLLVNTLSQDGHGLLPLLSYSLKDTFNVQIFTTFFAIVVGMILFIFGF